jgi:hypothetical protein
MLFDTITVISLQLSRVVTDIGYPVLVDNFPSRHLFFLLFAPKGMAIIENVYNRQITWIWVIQPDMVSHLSQARMSGGYLNLN